MTTEPYLVALMTRLADGLERLADADRARHAAYLRSAQNADGGFSGREGGSDLYYTGFGLRGLAVLASLAPEVCERAGQFLRGSLAQQAAVVDFFSLLYSCFLVQLGGVNVLADSPTDWPDRVTALLETFRTSDGGYAKTAGHSNGSVYHSFLVALCYQLLDRPLPRPEDALRFVHSRRRDDGGYVEIAAMRRSGTNPTAAAVGLLQMLGTPDCPGLTAAVPEAVATFMVAMVSPEGGLRGNSRAPVADLLSTFTGLWTLDRLAALDRIEGAAALDYVRALELPQGGFRGGLWDDRTDVEYTFYGLGSLALLTP
jgi:geranylgeranyl transferase type-2 subunit beta